MITQERMLSALFLLALIAALLLGVALAGQPSREEVYEVALPSLAQALVQAEQLAAAGYTNICLTPASEWVIRYQPELKGVWFVRGERTERR